MTEEIKARVKSLEGTRNRLENVASFEGKKQAKDIYFNQPGKSVLKIRKEGETAWLVRFKPLAGGFEKVEETELEDFEDRKNELKHRHGIKSVLNKEVYKYGWNDYDFLLISIEEVGDFLVVQGEEVGKEIFSSLNVDVEEYVNVPFSDLE